ncbi:AraC-like DNA-binding protein [Paenibacillus harenae]|uniref:AraC-like DNA-binding protein n=2 Tax=Paenibacillus harenae TaxID=306543 RepID=A0ABT9U394_PAEHA|nr:AraC-like DNA-binding protein [Paenibacillus harenae]
MNINEQLTAWVDVSITMIDVWHSIIKESTNPYKRYVTPENGFIYVVSGKAKFACDESEYTLQKSDVFYAGKNMNLDVFILEEPFEYYIILFSVQQDASCLEGQPFRSHYTVHPEDPINLFQKIDSMYGTWNKPGALSKLYVKALFYHFIHDLFQQAHLKGSSAGLIERSILYMNENFRENLSLHSLSQFIGSSPGYFSNLFKKQTGISPIEFLTHIRINKAKELLLLSDAALREIANHVGYSDVYYFNRIFKKYTGMPPGQYRMKR